MFAQKYDKKYIKNEYIHRTTGLGREYQWWSYHSQAAIGISVIAAFGKSVTSGVST